MAGHHPEISLQVVGAKYGQVGVLQEQEQPGRGATELQSPRRACPTALEIEISPCTFPCAFPSGQQENLRLLPPPLSPPPRPSSPPCQEQSEEAPRNPSVRPAMATKLMQKFVDSYDDGGDAGQQDAGCVRAVLAELVLTFLFVFTVVSAAMAAGSGVKAGEAMPMATLAAVAITNALAAGVLVTAGFHVSGGHLNPAVTVAMMVRGHLSKLRTVLYVAAQLLASSLACILLRYLTGGMVTPVHALGAGIRPMQGLVMEVILTFSLLFVTYAMILDPRSQVRTIGPLLTGLIVGANSLAGGNFTGASMNPARSFGPALATGDWTHHWVYWLGPLLGGSLAAVVYESLFVVNKTHEPLLNGDC
nr:aquaporin TIP4-2-like [Setaria viridis]